MRSLVMAGMLWACACIAQAATSTVDITAFSKRDGYDDIRISPTGEYFAARVPGENNSVLMIVRRADNKPMAGFGLGEHTYIGDFEWVNPTRVVFGTERRFGTYDRPYGTGDLYGINADGTGKTILVGQDVQVQDIGSLIKPKKTELVAAFLVDTLPGDDRNVLVRVQRFQSDAFSEVDRMDVYTGRRTPVARAPVRNADYATDPQGYVRFAYGSNGDRARKLYFRASGSADWTDASAWVELNDEAVTHHAETPIGFSADGRIAYLEVEQPTGPDAIVAFDTKDRTRKQVLRDDVSDPTEVIRGFGASRNLPVGVVFGMDRPKTAFFDEAGPEARLYRSLEAAFPGRRVDVTSTTSDGRVALFEVSSDHDRGQFYLFDNVTKHADYLLARRDWQDPVAMADITPFAFKARDGMAVHGLLTVPRGSSGKHLPLVVVPHGGPYTVADLWEFDPQVQLLAASGYAVLQVNFRGSSGYGRAFAQAGAQEWGGKMQDDLTDATRWAIAQDVADAGRICIFGGSYGGYAALMGAAKEPALYRCAVGYVGVYDLPMMFEKGDVRRSTSGATFLSDWIGDPASLGRVSPVNLAGQIKVPVFLAAGGNDERAPIRHTQEMEEALRKAGVPVESLYFANEGHGFYGEAHKVEFYTKLLGFLDRNIGAGHDTATAASAAAH